MAPMDRRLSRLSGLRLRHKVVHNVQDRRSCCRKRFAANCTDQTIKKQAESTTCCILHNITAHVITPPLGPGIGKRPRGYNLAGCGSDAMPSFTRFIQFLLNIFFVLFLPPGSPSVHLVTLCNIMPVSLSRPDNCAVCAVQVTKPARTPCRWSSRWA